MYEKPLKKKPFKSIYQSSADVTMVLVINKLALDKELRT